MAVQGAMIWFDRTLKKIADGTLSLSSDTFHASLLTATQAMSATFVGASGDARYADLTAELATASGYTIGGLALSSVSLARAAVNQTVFTSAPLAWTLTGTITFKYMAIYDFTTTNKDLIGFCDMDTTGGSVSPVAGPLQIQPDATLGWLYWYQ